MKRNANAKFNETVEIHIKLGVDPKKSDQNVRGTVNLPHGTGRTVRVIAFARGDAARAAQEAGADVVGEADLIERVKGGFSDFDVAVATPDMMPSIGKELGRILAQKMPNPKAGTVSPNMAKPCATSRPARWSTASTRPGSCTRSSARRTFEESALTENVGALLDAIVRAKPAAAKGTYLRSITLASTMGPGVKVDPSRVKPTANTA